MDRILSYFLWSIRTFPDAVINSLKNWKDVRYSYKYSGEHYDILYYLPKFSIPQKITYIGILPLAIGLISAVYFDTEITLYIAIPSIVIVLIWISIFFRAYQKAADDWFSEHYNVRITPKKKVETEGGGL